ncbi:MAG: hypothetical protein N2545_09560 [Thermoflexales bacterium]|nr:hypothetical protein [Thermoflexales bacterium]
MNQPSTSTRPLNLRPALRVGLIGGSVLGLATFAQQAATSAEMQLLGLVIMALGPSVVGYYATRQSAVRQRNAALSAGGLGGLVAGLFMALAFIAAAIMLALDPAEQQALVELAQQQLSELQRAQLQAAGVDLRALVQLSLGLTIACCGVGLPLLGLLTGAIGGLIALPANQKAPLRKR